MSSSGESSDGILFSITSPAGASATLSQAQIETLLRSVPVNPNPDDPAEAELVAAVKPLRGLLHPPSS